MRIDPNEFPITARLFAAGVLDLLHVNRQEAYVIRDAPDMERIILVIVDEPTTAGSFNHTQLQWLEKYARTFPTPTP